MRYLDDHIVAGDTTEQLTILVSDEPGQGEYSIIEPVKKGGLRAALHAMPECQITFQNGPIKEHGVNGITQEALLAIVIDRLRSFQLGPFSCRENAIALTNCEEALMWLQRRTVARIKRGVEGTNQK